MIREADVLYINFKEPNQADDSEITDDDVIVRYEKGNVYRYHHYQYQQKKCLTGTFLNK